MFKSLEPLNTDDIYIKRRDGQTIVTPLRTEESLSETLRASNFLNLSLEDTELFIEKYGRKNFGELVLNKLFTENFKELQIVIGGV